MSATTAQSSFEFASAPVRHSCASCAVPARPGPPGSPNPPATDWFCPVVPAPPPRYWTATNPTIATTMTTQLVLPLRPRKRKPISSGSSTPPRPPPPGLAPAPPKEKADQQRQQPAPEPAPPESATAEARRAAALTAVVGDLGGVELGVVVVAHRLPLGSRRTERRRSWHAHVTAASGPDRPPTAGPKRRDRRRCDGPFGPRPLRSRRFRSWTGTSGHDGGRAAGLGTAVEVVAGFGAAGSGAAVDGAAATEEVGAAGATAAEGPPDEGAAAAEGGAFGGAGAGGNGGAESDGDRADSDFGRSVAGTAAPAGSTESRVFISSTR